MSELYFTHYSKQPLFQKIKYQLNIKICTDDEKVNEFYNNFSSHHMGDSGIDLYYPYETIGENTKVSTIDYKIRCEMIDLESNEYTSYYLVPRSSLAKTDFQMANSVGIIDAGYRGNIMAKIRCFGNSVLPPGSYFQIVSPDLKPIKVKIVEKLCDTSRNDGGFGSTSKV